MTSYQKVAILALLVVAIASNGVLVEVSHAQTICNVSLQGLMSCKPSATPPNPAPPSGACCSALSRANMPCLCSYKNSKVLPSLGIDPNLAMQLPANSSSPHYAGVLLCRELLSSAKSWQRSLALTLG
ncbi:hypothetical protein RJ640_010580 [Escallonia rubra]|uniref:Bifunctional inhibitor/plant lipid transfer protein/seed storage helical domain-containing protein n=1 Tax=Escallonia rubra TaxID=112253 RepID=A0AA88RCE7_9ASTE|nr:hypothetical protein RJ640_010580 [Escallonia rubra]